MRPLLTTKSQRALARPSRTFMITAGLVFVSLTACQSNGGGKSISTSSHASKVSSVSPKASLAPSTKYAGRKGYAGGKPVRASGYRPMKVAFNDTTPPARLYLGSAKYICSASGFGSRASCKLRK